MLGTFGHSTIHLTFRNHELNFHPQIHLTLITSFENFFFCKKAVLNNWAHSLKVKALRVKLRPRPNDSLPLKSLKRLRLNTQRVHN